MNVFEENTRDSKFHGNAMRRDDDQRVHQLVQLLVRRPTAATKTKNRNCNKWEQELDFWKGYGIIHVDQAR